MTEGERRDVCVWCVCMHMRVCTCMCTLFLCACVCVLHVCDGGQREKWNTVKQKQNSGSEIGKKREALIH